MTGWASRSLVAAAAVAACLPARPGGPQRAGERKIEGGGQALVAVPHASAALYLRNPVHPAGKLMPPDAFLGELLLLTASGQTKVLASAATNLTGNLAFSSDGSQVAFLDHFSFESHRGDLMVAATASGATRSVAQDVAYFGFRGGAAAKGAAAPLFGAQALGEVAGERGELQVDGQVIDVEVATFEFVKGGDLVVYRQRSSAGGDLRVFGRLDGASPAARRTVATGVGDYQIAPDGSGVAYTLIAKDGSAALHLSRWGLDDRLLGLQVSSFAFSPDGRSVAYVAGLDLGKLLGDLYVVDLDKRGPPEKLGRSAGSYRFGADGRLAFIHDYYEPNRSGKLSLWDRRRGVSPIVPSARVFGFSPSGKFLGYLKRVFNPLYTEQLMLLPLGALGSPLGESKLVGEGIYAFDFTPDEAALLYKTDCTRGGEACELMSVPTDAPAVVAAGDGGVAKNPASRKLVSAIDGYDFSPDGKWMWATFKSAIGSTADLAVLPGGAEPGLPRYIDFKVEPGPRWSDDGHLIYLVNLPKRAGLYLADPAKAQSLLQR